ncbi:hypothetical protein C7C46_08415 [Streptomyces tateyamensis]|uniref:Uncharacterized protein n=1 Tax=Streptomyces tateyamensis TaxID=565073 RepID=A0A2V4PF81_9ACTN|nr:hypothetical protein [Streptomyces tateyamensis]PYC83761.1 hypothetical protein C7C46_08415 [Streptomyces tateyamensis]
MSETPRFARRTLWIAVVVLGLAASTVGWMAWDRSGIHKAPVAGDLLLSADGRTLTAAVSWTDCEDRPKLIAHETAHGVGVALEIKRHVQASPNTVCDGWQDKLITATLHEPLGDRPINDTQTAATITPFKASALLAPQHLPAGYAAADTVAVADHSKSPFTRGGTASWTTTYIRDRNAGGDAGGISITQALGEHPDPPATPVTINNHAGSLVTSPGNRYTVNWVAEGYTFTVRMSDRRMTENDAVQIADQLAPVGTSAAS